MRFRFSDLGKILGIEVQNDLPISCFQIDSRLVQEGGVFFALKGEKTDGHHHLEEVAKKGGIGAVVSKEYAGQSFGLHLFPVLSVEDALRLLAKKNLEKTPRLQIVGVTGSLGKTTTKDFIATLLEGKYKIAKTEKSQNSKLTLPLTILNRPGDEEVIILEMGMSKPGELKRLIEIAPPDIAVLTKVAFAHAENFPEGIGQIAQAKGEIFQSSRTRYAVFEESYLPFSAAIASNKCYFSLQDESADFFLSVVDGICKVYEKGALVFAFEFPFPQKHFLHNFLASLCVALHLKMNWQEIEKQIPKLQLPKMRFEKIEMGGVIFINDAYNASPESMKAALSSLPKVNGKTIAVLGTMKELGRFSSLLHAEVGSFAQKYVDHLLVLGEEAHPLYTAFQESKKTAQHFSNYKDVVVRLKEIVQIGDVVLIKGSRSLSMERILEDLIPIAINNFIF